MSMNYTLGNGQGPRKPKKMKRPTTPEEAGEANRATRAARFNNAKDREKVQTTMDINNKSKKMIDQGLKLNDHGIPSGDQQHKKFKKLGPIQIPKFRRKN